MNQGVDKESTQKAREHMVPFPPSSPARRIARRTNVFYHRGFRKKMETIGNFF